MSSSQAMLSLRVIEARLLNPLIRTFVFRAPDGSPLPGVYAVWLVVVVALYPLCNWFAGVKKRRSDWWLSYL